LNPAVALVLPPEYRWDIVTPGGKRGGPPPKAPGLQRTDSEEYREGTVKSPPGGE
jgi:hypothetical protein